MSSDAALALNAGSSSVKFALFDTDRPDMPDCIVKGQIDEIGTSPHFIAKDAKGSPIGERHWAAGTGYEALLKALLEWIDDHLGSATLSAVGHRVVHGGSEFTGPVRLDRDVLKSLDALTPLAPLHQPHCLTPIRAIMSIRPGLPQIACFDTAFHHTMPAVATRFALPRTYEEEGVRRYGFHGLSYEYISGALRKTAPGLAVGRVIVAHLGNGASLCAMSNGRSIDTTMGFTALDGLMMGTRCGSIDPGVLLYMLQEKRLHPAQLEDILYKQSGLLGVSGISADMRDLIGNDDVRAREAIELFVYRIARETAALTGTLGGLDTFVFTAGIGEHVAEIRAAVCKSLSWLGVFVDADANARHAETISASTSQVGVLVIPTDEETMIVRHTVETLHTGGRAK